MRDLSFDGRVALFCLRNFVLALSGIHLYAACRCLSRRIISLSGLRKKHFLRRRLKTAAGTGAEGKPVIASLKEFA